MNEIRKKRVEFGFTQAELAAKLGISVSTVSMWETAERKPDIVMLKKIANVFCCSTDELLSDIEIFDKHI